MLISGAKNNAAISLEAATTVAAPDAAKMAVDWSLIFQVGLKDVVCESAIRSKKIALCNCTALLQSFEDACNSKAFRLWLALLTCCTKL